MLSKVDSKKIGNRSGSEKLLNEIETISKALYLNKNLSKNSNPVANVRQRSTGKTNFPDPKLKPKSSNEDPTRKDKKSIWSWKTLKAFSHVRNRRFNCCFSLQVHSIKGLPSDLNDFSLSVFWKRRDGLLVTRPKKVVQGKVEFEEELNCTCTVHGSGNGPHHSAKYEAKHFLLYASVYGASEVDLGKHRVDLTRLLPLTLEELEEEKSSGKWATSFKLSGKAKGATMSVSFGYMVVGDNLTASGNQIGDSLKSKQNKYDIGKSEMLVGESGGRSRIQSTESIPGKMNNNSLISSQSVDDIKDLHEVLPIPKLELAKSVDLLYKKFDDGKLEASADSNPELNVSTEYCRPMKSDSYPSAPENENADVDCGTEFSFVERGIEVPFKEQVEKIEVGVEVSSEEQVEKIDVKDVDSSSDGRPAIENELSLAHEEGSRVDQQEEEHDSCTEEVFACNSSSNDYDIYTKESILKELESALSCVSELESAAMESPEEEQVISEFKSSDEPTGKGMSLDLEDEFLESDFLRMLGLEQSPSGLSSESEPESPRERLLRQFEEEAVAGGYSLFNFDIEDENYPACGYNFNVSSEFGDMVDTAFDMPSTVDANEGMCFIDDEARRSKMKAKMLEDLETEVLMHKWGLNEEAFQQSPSSSSHGFGSPVDMPCGEPFELPPLGEGLGSFIQTKSGGFLRSMNPAIFQNAKSGGNLIMQVSTPVVVPAEMGSGIMEILQRLASVGIEKLSMQANKLMPLEDITGKTMQQVAWEAITTLEGSERQGIPQSEPVFKQDPFDRRKTSMGKSSGSRHEKFSSNSMRGEPETEYVSLEDVAPLALDKIEALSMEGLRIQSGMSEDEAPSNISAQSIGEFSALRGKGIDISGSLGLEGTAGLQLLDIKDNGDDVDGLMGLSLSLDEWMRLDSGELDDEEIISEHTSKVLAAHHANSLDFIHGGTKGGRRGKSSSRKCGLLGNNFTVALMVQLRDPLRNYEPVGAPMLSLIQVERVFIPPKPKIYNTVSEVRNNYDEEDEIVARIERKEEPEEKASEQQGIPQFRITEVHVAGIKTEPNKKLWGTSTSNQQKSGSRWLVANGMGKSKKHPFLKTKAAAPKSSAPELSKVQPPGDREKDSLWSISSGAKWKAFSALNPLVRNPNVVFPNENFRLR
ncbi:protein PLASTID MOVEMENT IMPAIRED 1-RELATED 1 [Benincasa hispida]|uniref:protein PLASTID MOVEMENT IMPAIRED 1-RELATED 1 n=1 Tax=Benincasa hispida TaxID=102211 RepID=UPI001902859D|nr:protein PLASTID MOVEMENT IMPAIRED 1-RELATED 1 [Benincasa hispida]XP_038878741.1 protein PLASTID MOVEMENT IMPAIRED 1-RELATED 1 [Benincasa hispida]